MRLIDADAMKADLLTVDPQYETMIEWCISVLDAQPTIEPKKGEWIDFSMSIKGVPTEACGECGEWSLDMGKNFCPNCGADMRKGPN